MSVLVQKQNENASPLRVTRSGSSSRSNSSFDSNGTRTLYVKGAPEQILDRCTTVRLSKSSAPVPLTRQLKDKILAKVSEWAEKEALRVLAFATVENPNFGSKVDPSMYESMEVSS
jgi:magnesium-transporting ATPase (P-type)